MAFTTPALYVCTDLDRTLLPNGDVPEPQGARESFAQLVARPEVGLVYVSGRDRQLILDAMREYAIPTPDFVIADVGTSIYQVSGDSWQLLTQWHDLLGADWQGNSAAQLHAMLGEIEGLTLQVPGKQGRFKLSFERQPADGLEKVVDSLKDRLAQLPFACHCVSSIDETSNTGLVDVLPGTANKCAALQFIRDFLGIRLDQMVFSGDSGNDLDVLLSPMRATLVGNATEEVRSLAIKLLEKHQGSNLYLASAPYAAGILEGIDHYFPDSFPQLHPSYAARQEKGL